MSEKRVGRSFKTISDVELQKLFASAISTLTGEKCTCDVVQRKNGADEAGEQLTVSVTLKQATPYVVPNISIRFIQPESGK